MPVNCSKEVKAFSYRHSPSRNQCGGGLEISIQGRLHNTFMSLRN